VTRHPGKGSAPKSASMNPAFAAAGNVIDPMNENPYHFYLNHPIPYRGVFMNMRSVVYTAVFFCVTALVPAAAFAAMPTFTLSIKDHKFDPTELHVPAGQKIKLMVKNLDKTPEEFESHEMKREKVIPGGTTGTVYIGPPDAGTYKFFGDFHQATAQGKIIAK
jgi:plastocyanin